MHTKGNIINYWKGVKIKKGVGVIEHLLQGMLIKINKLVIYKKKK